MPPDKPYGYGDTGGPHNFYSRRFSNRPLERTVSSGSSTFQRQPSEPAPLHEEQAVDDDVSVRGPYGLSVLYSPKEVLVDFIFVHGLRGGSRKTWTKDDDPRLFWPQEWLPQDPDLQNVRISTFGYNSDWMSTKDSFVDVHHFGQSLVSGMLALPSLRRQQTPILLIGHSMGGLVIKKAYLLAREISSNLAQRIQSIFFLATPHNGSEFATVLNNILKLSKIFPTRQYVSDLESNSPTLRKITDEFVKVSQGLQIWSFYETLKTKVSALHSVMIVEPKSAILGLPNETPQLLNADHRSVCKFKTKSDPNYLAVRNALVTAVEELMGDDLKLEVTEKIHQLQALTSYLNVTDKVEEYIAVLEEAKTAGSCEWAVKESSFKAWRDSLQQDPQIYYLTGPPGAGKSIVATHIIRHLQDLGYDCFHYFFRRGRKGQQTVAGCLRSFLYQLANRHYPIRAILMHLRTKGFIFDKDDERIIWQEILVKEVFQVDLQRTQYWTLDGLDECIDWPRLISFFANLPTNFTLRILITSRKLPEMQKHFARINPDCLTTGSVDAEGTQEDIQLFIRENSAFLPVEEGSQNQLVKSLVSRSGGCFLWAKLVLERLDLAHSEDDMESALMNLPTEMALLYQQIVTNMSQKPTDVKLARSILSWTTCGTRTLSVKELQYALNLDLKTRILNVERSVDRLCGQFLWIDKSRAVQVIHTSARDFLLDSELESVFALNKEECHTRLAISCLEYLNGDSMRPPRSHHLLQQREHGELLFADYASTSFAEHLGSASPVSAELARQFDRFLKSNVLTWIEYTASRKKNLYYFTRATKHINTYLRRRENATPPVSPGHSSMTRWATDIMRVAAKFGRNLLEYPSTIHFIIPPLCPRDTGIYKEFGSPYNGMRLVGFTNPAWDDCISHVEYRDSRAMCLAGGGSMLVIGMRNGKISLCSQSTGQEIRVLQHGEAVRKLRFDHNYQHIVSSGNKLVKLWTVTGELRWTYDMRNKAAAFEFSSDNRILHIVNASNDILSLQCSSGEALAHRQYPGSASSPQAYRSPVAVSFSPDTRMVAIAYRGTPVEIWAFESSQLVGICGEDDLHRHGQVSDCHAHADRHAHVSVQEMVFNPSPAIDLLAVTHQDGELTLYNSLTQQELKTLDAGAYTIAASNDGRTLATGDLLGKIQLWDFETLTLLYSIQSYEYAVKSLVFSSDGLKLFDIRDTKATIWEPSVLVRKNISDDSSSGSETYFTAQSVSNRDDELVEITAILPASGKTALVGKDDGTVHVYGCDTGSDQGVLYSHAKGVFIAYITWSFRNIIVSADASGRICAYMLDTSRPGNWKVAACLLDHNIGRPIAHIDLSPDSEHLLVGHQDACCIFTLSSEEPLSTMAVINCQETLSWQWANSGSELLSLSEKEISVHSMNGLSKDVIFKSETIPALEATTFRNFVKIQGADLAVVELDDSSGVDGLKYLVLSATENDSYDNSQRSSTTGLEPNVFLKVNSVRDILGAYDDRLVILDPDLWVQTLAISASDKSQLNSKHYFIPYEFIGGNNGVSGCITPNGDLLLPRQGELGVIKNGLKGVVH